MTEDDKIRALYWQGNDGLTTRQQVAIVWSTMATSVQVPKSVLLATDINLEEKLTLCILYALADKSGFVGMTAEGLSKFVGRKGGSVRRHLRELEGAGYMARGNHYGDHGTPRYGLFLKLRANGTEYAANSQATSVAG